MDWIVEEMLALFVSAIITWDMNYFVWFELSSNTPSLLIVSLERYYKVPQLFLSYKPPFDLQLMTAKELFGLIPNVCTYFFGTAKTTWPIEIAPLIMLGISLSVIRYFLTGAPVRSLK